MLPCENKTVATCSAKAERLIGMSPKRRFRTSPRPRITRNEQQGAAFSHPPPSAQSLFVHTACTQTATFAPSLYSRLPLPRTPVTTPTRALSEPVLNGLQGLVLCKHVLVVHALLGKKLCPRFSTVRGARSTSVFRADSHRDLDVPCERFVHELDENENLRCGTPPKGRVSV